MRRIWTALSLCILLAGTAAAQTASGTAAAQPVAGTAAQPVGPPPPQAPPGMRKAVRERMNILRAVKLTNALGLDETTAERFFPLLHRYDERLTPLHRQQGEFVMRLRVEVETGHPDPARLARIIDDLLTIRRQVAALEDERIREVRKVLSPIQQAKLVLVMPRIERDLRRTVRKARGLPREEE